VPEDHHADAREVDALGIDPVGQCDQHRDRQHVGAIEGGRDPAGFAVGEAPARDHFGQQRGPEECADLHQNLRRADQRDKADR
jgi:hypothetical protein